MCAGTQVHICAYCMCLLMRFMTLSIYPYSPKCANIPKPRGNALQGPFQPVEIYRMCSQVGIDLHCTLVISTIANIMRFYVIISTHKETLDPWPEDPAHIDMKYSLQLPLRWVLQIPVNALHIFLCCLYYGVKADDHILASAHLSTWVPLLLID